MSNSCLHPREVTAICTKAVTNMLTELWLISMRAEVVTTVIGLKFTVKLAYAMESFSAVLTGAIIDSASGVGTAMNARGLAAVMTGLEFALSVPFE